MTPTRRLPYFAGGESKMSVWEVVLIAVVATEESTESILQWA